MAKTFEQLLHQENIGENRLADFFDIQTDDRKEIARELDKTVNFYQDKQIKPLPVSPYKWDGEYEVSGYDEFRSKNNVQSKIELGTKKPAKELLGSFKLMDNIQLPAIYEDPFGNIWTKIGGAYNQQGAKK
jgi:uncharacterized protein with von Willebrand factor type A (vWA) domain